MLNIVYKTTTHVSIGDDIAFLGTKSLFDKLLPSHNAFIYSRDEKDSWKSKLPINVDLVVIAGTPIWSGKQMASLENFVIENDTPIFYCGVGMNYGGCDRTSDALKRSIGFIARDNHAYKRAIKDTHARSFGCPSIFSTGIENPTDDKIGIIPQFDTFPEEQMAYIKKHDPLDTLIICNEIIDYQYALSHLGQYKIVYSRWLADMKSFYLMCKSIYSMRIHGAHLAYALGIPTVCLKSEKDKSVVVKKIGLELVPPDKVTPADLRNNQNIKRELYVKFMDYISISLKKHFPDQFSDSYWSISSDPHDGVPLEWAK